MHIHPFAVGDDVILDDQAVVLGETLTEPREGECVLCYVDRMLDAFGCDTTLRWARRWRDRVRPRATALERRLQAAGGFCDCEVFANGWARSVSQAVCAGLGATSVRPCANWRPRRRDDR